MSQASAMTYPEGDPALRERGQRPIIYLACPYTHPDPKVRGYRFQAATQAAADLIREGHIVYSPITMTHPIDVVLAGEDATLGSDYWVTFDEAFMDACSEMIVLMVDGWDESSGIRREINYFREHGKPVAFMSPGETIPHDVPFSRRKIQK